MRRQIIKVLEQEVNPMVASHGGRIDVEDYINGNVYIRMSGGCQGCASSKATLKQGVERALKQAFGDKIHSIIDVTDHAGGANPYYN
jgi:Fe-S cluster biogenesis protein NfuA